jgi:hypothetical protein
MRHTDLRLYLLSKEVQYYQGTGRGGERRKEDTQNSKAVARDYQGTGRMEGAVPQHLQTASRDHHGTGRKSDSGIGRTVPQVVDRV